MSGEDDDAEGEEGVDDGHWFRFDSLVFRCVMCRVDSRMKTKHFTDLLIEI